MHVPNLKNDEYKEPKAKNTGEERGQGNSKNSRGTRRAKAKKRRNTRSKM